MSQAARKTKPQTPSPTQGHFDVVIIGGGASGMVAAISAARTGRRPLISEKSPSLGRKLLASGGERCNLSNTLSTDDFMGRVTGNGRFMGPALEGLGGPKLREFFEGIGLKTVVHDGFRVWPETRKSSSVLQALIDEVERLEIPVSTDCCVEEVAHDGANFQVRHGRGHFHSTHLVLATGGLALPKSGASGLGYSFAESFGHRCTPRYPAGVPLVTKEDWTARLTAHTVGKAHLQVALPKLSRFQATGDLIFTKKGIRGPVVLDISREISPLLEKHGQVPLVLNLCRGRNQEDWQKTFKAWRMQPNARLTERLTEFLPTDISEVLLELAAVPLDLAAHSLKGKHLDDLVQILVKTPLTITDTTGFDGAFVTRGGVHLKEVRPGTLESKIQPGLYFCGEVLNLDGPCGGFNLQWAFASGYLAGQGLVN